LNSKFITESEMPNWRLGPIIMDNLLWHTKTI